MNEDMEMMRKEAVVVQLEVLPWHLPGRTEATMENLVQDSW